MKNMIITMAVVLMMSMLIKALTDINVSLIKAISGS